MLIVFALLVAVYVMRSQDEFLTEIRETIQSGADYYVVCEISGGATSENCDAKNSSQSAALIEAIRQAKMSLPPGKATVAYEGILRIGRGDPHLKKYIGCYRIVQYVGFEETIFLNKVETNSDCTYVQRYEPGYVSLPSDSFKSVESGSPQRLSRQANTKGPAQE